MTSGICSRLETQRICAAAKPQGCSQKQHRTPLRQLLHEEQPILPPRHPDPSHAQGQVTPRTGPEVTSKNTQSRSGAIRAPMGSGSRAPLSPRPNARCSLESLICAGTLCPHPPRTSRTLICFINQLRRCTTVCKQ